MKIPFSYFDPEHRKEIKVHQPYRNVRWKEQLRMTFHWAFSALMPFRSRPQRVLGKCVKAPTSNGTYALVGEKLFPLRNLLICVTVFHALIIWTPTSWNFWHFLTLAARAAGTSPQFIYLFAFNTWPCLELVSAIRWFDLNSFAVKKFSAMFYVLRMRMAKRRTVGEGKGKETPRKLRDTFHFCSSDEAFDSFIFTASFIVNRL